jgi:hypothetical protein
MTSRYLIGLWIITILVAPFIYGAYEAKFDAPGQVVTLIEVFPITIIFASIFSLPTLITALLLIRLIDKASLPNIKKKIIVIVLIVIGIMISLQVMGGSLVPVLTFTYVTALIIATLIMELLRKFKKTTYNNS